MWWMIAKTVMPQNMGWMITSQNWGAPPWWSSPLPNLRRAATIQKIFNMDFGLILNRCCLDINRETELLQPFLVVEDMNCSLIVAHGTLLSVSFLLLRILVIFYFEYWTLIGSSMHFLLIGTWFLTPSAFFDSVGWWVLANTIFNFLNTLNNIVH
jgi:hypothetical protein